MLKSNAMKHIGIGLGNGSFPKSRNDGAYVFCTLFEGSGGEVRVATWAEGIEICEFDGEEWFPIIDDPYLVVLSGERAVYESPYEVWYQRGSSTVSHELWRHFRATVPSEVQQVVECFRYSQLQLLAALYHCPRLLELAKSCPMLFWLVVEKNSDPVRLRSQEFRTLLACRRQEILEQLGYVGTNAAVNFLNRIEVWNFKDDDLFAVKAIVSSRDILREMRHFGRISQPHLAVGAQFRDLLRHGFVRNELLRPDCTLPGIKRLAGLFEDVKALAAVLGESRLDDRFRNLGTAEELEVLHDRLVERMGGGDGPEQLPPEQIMKYANIDFPSPPLPGNGAIQPIASFSDLLQESYAMKHCVASYVERIIGGGYYCYKISQPERCTIGLAVLGGRVEIDQVQLRKNQRPSAATLRKVNEWLKNSAAEFRQR